MRIGAGKAYFVDMSRTAIAIYLVGWGALMGCAPSLTPRMRGMRQAWSPVQIALFLPVEGRHRDNGGEFLDDAPQVVREAIAKELTRRGCSLVSFVNLDSLVTTTVGYQDITFGQAAKIAAGLGADVALVGKILDYRRGWLFGPSTRVELRFDVVAVDGQGLGATNYAETAAQEDPAELARDLSLKIAQTMCASWGGCGTK